MKEQTLRRENLRSVAKTYRISLDISSKQSRSETAQLRIYVNAIQVWFNPPQQVASSRADTLAAQDVRQQRHINSHLCVWVSKLISCSQVVWKHHRPGQLDLRELRLEGSSLLMDLATPDEVASTKELCFHRAPSVPHYPFSLFTAHLYVISVFCRKTHHFYASFWYDFDAY